jgi:predicted MPP superfamily phosphohydrolase
MARAVSFVIFFSILTGLSALTHYYFWLRLVRDMSLPEAWSRPLLLVVVVLAALIPASLLGMMLVGGQAMQPLLIAAFVWMGICLLLLLSLGAGDLLRGALSVLERLSQDQPPDAPERRVLAQRILGAGAAVATLALAAISTREGLGPVGIKRIEVSLARLPQAFDGFRIVQLTDVHVGPMIGKEFVERIVGQANALKPDVIVITGDLVDGSVSELQAAVAPLGTLSAKHGVFFVTGNHEFYSGTEAWCAHLGKLGINVLRNAHVTLREGEAGLDLAGVDDYSSSGHAQGPDADVEQACLGRDESRELILLAHQPRHVRAAERHKVGLQLSGHTHGGQMWPWNFLVRLGQPLVTGLARFGQTWLYVSNGTGYWGPPMRLAAPSEITEITLRAEPRRNAAEA